MDPASSGHSFPVACHLYDSRYAALSPLPIIPGSQVFAADTRLLHTTQCVVVISRHKATTHNTMCSGHKQT